MKPRLRRGLKYVRIGVVGVDSASLLLIDPSYIDDVWEPVGAVTHRCHDGKSAPPRGWLGGGTYETVAGGDPNELATLNHPPRRDSGQVPFPLRTGTWGRTLAVVSQTNNADGTYAVYVIADRAGYTVGLFVDFTEMVEPP